MDLGLKGRKAIVTGGPKSIGVAVAQELVAEGTTMAICARHADEVQEALERLRQGGTTPYGWPADVSTSASIQGFVPRTIEELSGTGVLVNNAGRASSQFWRCSVYGSGTGGSSLLG